jgi:hypothetical protein
MRFFSRFKIILKQYPDALRALVAVADRVEAVAVAQDDLEILFLRRKGYAAARACVPVAWLLKTGQITQMSCGGFQPELPAMRTIRETD